MKRSELSALDAGGVPVSDAPASRPTAVNVAALSTCAGASGALQQISLNIEEGCQIALVGPKGSGKSALLSCIAGAEKPKEGSIEAKGRLVKVEQKVSLLENKTVLENAYEGVRTRRKWRSALFGIPKKEKERAKEIVARFGLRSLANAEAKNLEPVEKILVAIAKALMEEPDILLLDEPISGLGFRDSNQVLKLLHEEAKQLGLTTITVLNNFGLAGKYSDRVVALEKGVIVYDGTSSDPWPEQRLSVGD